jgi:hypothetical protein
MPLGWMEISTHSALRNQKIEIKQQTLHSSNGTVHLKNVHNYLIANIYSYSETSCGQSSNLYLNVIHVFNANVN